MGPTFGSLGPSWGPPLTIVASLLSNLGPIFDPSWSIWQSVDALSRTIMFFQRKRQQCARDFGANLPLLGHVSRHLGPRLGQAWPVSGPIFGQGGPLWVPIFGNLGMPLKRSWTHLRSTLSYLALFGCLLTQNATMCERSWRQLAPSWGPSSAIVGRVLGKPNPSWGPPLAKVAPLGARL